VFKPVAQRRRLARQWRHPVRPGRRLHRRQKNGGEIEGQQPALPLDRIQRAEKRGWVAAAADLTAARGLRNRIAHEYDAEGWRQIARAVYALVPSLLLSVERTLAAGKRLVSPGTP
jgi:hypothetical protein